VKWRNYGSTGQIQSETNFWISNTFNDTISYAYNQGHRTNLNLTEPSGSWSETYGYDSFWRFATITSPAGTFGYQYVLGAQSLVAGISLPNGSMITNSFDANARLTGTALMNSLGGTMDDYQYLYNQGNQRTSCLRAGGIPNYVNYSYDPIGEVTSDLAYESISNTLRNNEQLYYLYDAAGNLQYRTNNALIQNFQVNSLNELTSETNGGRLTVMGTTTPIATNVTVNSSNAVIYGDYTFAATNMPLTSNYTALALGGGLAATNGVTFNLSSNAVFQYDGNGNLTNDGWRNFVYDDENQLIQVSVPGQWMSQFVYDGKKRRRIRTEFSSEGGAWVQTNQVLYVYDGNLAIQERASNNAVQVTYTRGRDMTGSLDGAGGIGGLLARTDTNGSTYYHADGNGNITMLINSSQAVAAKYLYDAFGNVLSASGLLAEANCYQFSSKEEDLNSGLVYYLYRFYDPNLQRWVNRDPIGVFGGINLYTFVLNKPIGRIDLLGLFGQDADSSSGGVNGPPDLSISGPAGPCAGGGPPIVGNNDSPQELGAFFGLGLVAAAMAGLAGPDEAVAAGGLSLADGETVVGIVMDGQVVPESVMGPVASHAVAAEAAGALAADGTLVDGAEAFTASSEDDELSVVGSGTYGGTLNISDDAVAAVRAYFTTEP
jgi:RHS repeat-associated protein